jgi:hypothetical protein
VVDEALAEGAELGLAHALDTDEGLGRARAHAGHLLERGVGEHGIRGHVELGGDGTAEGAE